MKKVLIIIISVLLVIAIAALVFVSVISADMTIDADKEVKIEDGSSTAAIADTLAEAGLIKNSRYFRFYAGRNDIDSKLQAGTYSFSAGSWSIRQVCELLVLGTFNRDGQIQVTIPEGKTVKETAEILANAGLGTVENYLQYAATGDFSAYAFIPDSASEPATRLEGFLFPETYMIDSTWSEEQIFNMMLDQFVKVWADNDYDAIIANDGRTIYEVITMASIVEKEGKIHDERPMIASVFYNRLDIGSKFESCATVQFILGEPKEVLLYADLEIVNPYNTYKNEGLPPGPIAAPGKASIEATLNPAESEYLYFRAKTDGSHRFSKTFAEHNNHQEGDQ